MSWLADYVPWYVWMLLSFAGIGGGTAALIFFVPAALPFLLNIWAKLPLWLKVTLFAIFVTPFVYLAGRNAGSHRERAKNQARADNANRNRMEVENEVNGMSPSEVDKRLEEKGDFRD
jgi:membrane protein implicated in regulation of membrane protease activity